MKKILVAALAMAMAFTSCVKDEPVPPVKPGPGGDEPIVTDYSGLHLNELNGTPSKAEKYVEIYNSSDKAVSLDGVQFFYNGGVSWTGTSADVVPAKGFFCITGTKGTGMMAGGLSEDSNIRVELKDAAGKLIDFFQRGTGLNDTVLEAGHSFSRIPDGTGEWYYTAPEGTKGATNGTSAEGLNKVESTDPGTGGENPDPTPDPDPDPTPDPDADYSGLHLNELNGTPGKAEKYVEIYNSSDKAISLTGVQFLYNGEVSWTGAEGAEVPAGGFFCLTGTKGKGDMTLGLSEDSNIRVELRDPAGNLIDFFQRGNGLNDVPADTPMAAGHSFSRIPDGTGEWYFTAPEGTKEASNGDVTEGLDKVADEKGVGTEKVDPYAGLHLNEINGTPSKAEKYVELYNSSDKDVTLEGVQFFYNGNVSWTGTASDVVPAKGFFCITGTKGTGMMAGGLSEDSNIRVELKDAAGNLIDFFQRGTGLNDTVLEAGHSFSRIPDGTGEWYYTAPEGTKGATNGTSAEGLNKVETE